MRGSTRHPSPPSVRTILALALPLALAGCVTEGTAIGEAESGGRDVGRTMLEWTSDFADSSRGEIAGRMPDGTLYSGRYFQTAWAPQPALVTVDWEGNTSRYDSRATPVVHSSHVTAFLKAREGGKQLLCSFVLANPEAGLAGGGSGSCNTSDGKTIEHVVLAAPR
ncbi:MAG: hypothetical protein HOV80_28580 [Polyangiaceae bacterium]|nr:hypothetical protein [Polyangiaceae bacterium]